MNDERLKTIVSGGAFEEYRKLVSRLSLTKNEVRPIKQRKKYIINKEKEEKRLLKHHRRINTLIKKGRFTMKEFCYDDDETLTISESDIVELVMGGYNYAECAEILHLAESTIKTHINNIFQKRNVHNLQELLVKEFNRKYQINKKQTPEEIQVHKEQEENRKQQEKIKNAMKLFNKRW